jgi:Uma2 family endonuclease
MATSTPTPTLVRVPLDEYLNTTYRPDRDWIDGETQERNMGEMPHATVQLLIGHLLKIHAKEWNIRPLTEQRVQTSAHHYRIADVCVVRGDSPFEAIVRIPPLLCVEILSRDDRMSEIQERVEDYLAMGVSAVWVVDPRRRKSYTATLTGALEPAPEALTVPNTPIRIPVAEIYAELDELEGKSKPQP